MTEYFGRKFTMMSITLVTVICLAVQAFSNNLVVVLVFWTLVKIASQVTSGLLPVVFDLTSGSDKIPGVFVVCCGSDRSRLAWIHWSNESCLLFYWNYYCICSFLFFSKLENLYLCSFGNSYSSPCCCNGNSRVTKMAFYERTDGQRKTCPQDSHSTNRKCKPEVAFKPGVSRRFMLNE